MLNTVQDIYNFISSCGSTSSDLNNRRINTQEEVKKLIKDSVDHKINYLLVQKFFNGVLNKVCDSNFSMLPYSGIKTQFSNHVLIIGCGGIGSWFLPKFVKLVNDAKRKNLLSPSFKSITLCDGDEVEDSNLVRQNFSTRDVTKGKAECIYKRYVGELSTTVDFGYIDKYILLQESINAKPAMQKDRFQSLQNFSASKHLSNGDSLLIINLIDNNESRKDIHYFAKHHCDDAIVIDVANSLYNGQLNFSNYGAGAGSDQIGINNFSTYWDEIPENVFLNDKISVFDCSNADVQAVEQLFDINNMAATVLCTYINAWLEKGKIMNNQVSFGTGSNMFLKPENKVYDIFVNYNEAYNLLATYGAANNRILRFLDNMGNPLPYNLLNLTQSKGVDSKIFSSAMAYGYDINSDYIGNANKELRDRHLDLSNGVTFGWHRTNVAFDKKEQDTLMTQMYEYTLNQKNMANNVVNNILKTI